MFMIPRFIALALMALSCATFAENPFTTKFGGPYPSIDLSFKLGAAEYGRFWMGVYSTLGKAALSDKAGFSEFVKERVEPRLAALKPSGPNEEKVKAAAEFVKTVFEAQVDVAKFKPEELASINAFITAAVPPGEDTEVSSKLAFTLLRYQEFVTGVTVEQIQKLQGK